jgi:hypothetical protein
MTISQRSKRAALGLAFVVATAGLSAAGVATASAETAITNTICPILDEATGYCIIWTPDPTKEKITAVGYGRTKDDAVADGTQRALKGAIANGLKNCVPPADGGVEVAPESTPGDWIVFVTLVCDR